MIVSLNKKTITLATSIAIGGSSLVFAQSNTQEVAIEFEAWVGEDRFICGESYDRVGVAETTITPKDFRFYVSDVALIDENGDAVPLELEQDGKWQYQSTVLLDFEDGTGSCDNGTAETNTSIVGTVPEGNYQSLQFILGVPKNLNHEDAAIAPSPLNLTSMWWNWQGGYKFLRVDLETEEEIVNVSTQSTTTHSQSGEGNVQINQQHTTHSGSGSQTTTQTNQQTSIFKNGKGTHTQTSSTHSSNNSGNSSPEHQANQGHQQASSNGYLIHLGSTGCKDSARSSLFNCANPNRTTVTLEDFDPDNNVVIADLAELLFETDLTTNQANTPSGCMSSPEDSDCSAIMQQLGLAFNGTTPEGQNFFFVE